jgi:hypothetical protein
MDRPASIKRPPGCLYASITPLTPSSSKAVDLWYYLACMVMEKRWQHSLPSIHRSRLKSCFMYSVERQFSKTPFKIPFPRQARCQFRLVKTYSRSFIADRMCSLTCTSTSTMNNQEEHANQVSLAFKGLFLKYLSSRSKGPNKQPTSPFCNKLQRSQRPAPQSNTGSNIDQPPELPPGISKKIVIIRSTNSRGGLDAGRLLKSSITSITGWRTK